jgi:hypothetical protein
MQVIAEGCHCILPADPMGVHPKSQRLGKAPRRADDATHVVDQAADHAPAPIEVI